MGDRSGASTTTRVEADALVRFGVATLHEANGRHGLVRGVRLVVGKAFAGRAVTASIPSGDNLGIHLAMETAQPGEVLCVASRGQGGYGVVGDLLVELARARQLAAFVLDDGVRDLDVLEAPPAVAARSVTAHGTVKYRAIAVGEPCALGGTLVCPGDWVVGDADGVVVLPAGAIAAVVRAAEAREAKEEGLRQGARQGVRLYP